MHLDADCRGELLRERQRTSAREYDTVCRDELSQLQHLAEQSDRGDAQRQPDVAAVYRYGDYLHRRGQGGIASPNVQYQFYVQYKLANGSWSANTIIQNWSTSNQCIWTPTTAENYYVNVLASPVGDTAYSVATYISFNILPANLTGVTLTATPPSPQQVGIPLTLTATVQGGITAPNVQYQFYAQYKNADGSWAPNILIQDGSTSNQCTWTPATAEKYYLNVNVRPLGDTAAYAVTTYTVYLIQN